MLSVCSGFEKFSEGKIPNFLFVPKILINSS
ncbi:hypothetical protein vBEcoMWL3_gp191 [Escherichia phage vB_EcoM_WL-3]|nr:hypothetical protein vBEcoMWL3_gp191 [Escherichia phage vB_EcoM_WL-3]